MFLPVYLDYNASTPVAPAVLEAMLPHFAQRYGNASSRHEHGRAARRAMDEARQRVAAAVGAQPGEVVFTSGGSESNNLLVKGAAACCKPGVIAVSAVEHSSVREPAQDLARQGWTPREIAVDAQGRIDDADYQNVLALSPRILSVMLANNETGVLEDVARLAQQAKPRRAVFHTDAVQALGKLAIDFRELNAVGVHALTLSAHKVGGPKGIGALIVDKRIEMRPLIAGGGQERGLRAGTENVPAIVGFGVACELAAAQRESQAAHAQTLRDELECGLLEQGAIIFGRGATRLPNTTYFAFHEVDGETLVAKLDRAGFAVASGAACASASMEPSHVLLAMGVAPPLARGAVRVSLGGETRAGDIGNFLAALRQTVSQLKRLTAVVV